MVHDVEGRIKVIVAHSDQLEHDILSQNSGGNDNMQSRLVSGNYLGSTVFKIKESDVPNHVSSGCSDAISMAIFAKNHKPLLTKAALNTDPNSGKQVPFSNPVFAGVKVLKDIRILTWFNNTRGPKSNQVGLAWYTFF